MIVFETAPAPAVRAAEVEIAGRRIAGRLLPYGGESGAQPFRFDPVDRRFVFCRSDATVQVGPPDPGDWRDAVARLPAGPVLVGPCSAAEEIRGAYLAAAESALAAGRGVYLLDPEPAGLPVGAGPAVVALCPWRPGRPEVPFPGLTAAHGSGLPAAALFPLLPGWTAETETLESLAVAARDGGAIALAALVPSSDGESRRLIVEARSAVEPAEADRFFELVHHGDWSEQMTGRLTEVRKVAARRGLLTLPPRPVGRCEPRANAEAAARLEERAETCETDEHRTALLLAAVRWIDESSWDLSALAREGNFRKVFPFGPDLAAAAEAALREAR